MKKKFSTKWKASKQPRKQRKYRYNAPKHIQSKFINVHLDKELAKKHGIKRLRVKTGDKVRIMRGKFKGKEGKVDLINLKKSKVTITGIEVSKKDGSKSRPPFPTSNLLILELNLDDKKRLAKKQTQGKKQVKSEVKSQENKADAKTEVKVEAKKETKVKTEEKVQQTK
ncbi:MAG: 50S ribosomal protein L24 [Nanoarchaeota archaeon]|nr:50S ribosomal protein L24 [Nanoarchaeota archaeon]MBU1321361.1 50S ribosomal protein L24 [Nanoarchaeota archaeon]MBU1597353.1 50S ribosomal protein L24 [Nanoarchaeota archaeon]MBU2441268.1 50S ribosomal protein L24 [Nanoarchaeota archaeon]